MALMASSSATTPYVKHNVFLSFRGEDTRNNFTSHLHAALCRKSISTFIDEELERGDWISPSLLNAIKESQLSVIIFSEGYASSRWCLEELVEILDSKDRYGQIVLPVFYHVDPSHIRNQTGAFGKGFDKLVERYKDEVELLQKWRTALSDAAQLAGFTAKKDSKESTLVDYIVEDILKRLNDESPLVDNKDLIGVDSKFKYIEQLLDFGGIGVRKVGLWGIGGIGKTALAKAICNKFYGYFESPSHFINIREELEKGLGGLRKRGKKLISDILDDPNPRMRSEFTIQRIRRKKVFIILDDVIDLEQIKDLIEDLNYLGSGSRILITTRDRHVLTNCGVDQSNIYEIPLLSDDDSLQLFCQCAFRQNYPPKCFMELSSKIVKYAEGVPLALETLGYSLIDGTKQDWESAIKKFENVSYGNMQKVLKESYDRLEPEDKDIFLDISCFFEGLDIDLAKAILDAKGFNTQFGLKALIEKSLLKISFNNLTMLGLVQKLGKTIAREESIDNPGKRRRLCDVNDVYDVLTNNTGTEAIQGIFLDISKVETKIQLNPNAFTNMNNLRFLIVDGSHEDNKVHGFEDIEYDFAKLIYFYWKGYCGQSLPSKMCFKNLVTLEMPHSNIQYFRICGETLVNLKYINLKCSKHLSEIRNVSTVPNLERLNIEGCTNLYETFFSTKTEGSSMTVKLRVRTVKLRGYRILSFQFKETSYFIEIDIETILEILETIPRPHRTRYLKYLRILFSSYHGHAREMDDMRDMRYEREIYHMRNMRERYLTIYHMRD